MLQVFNSLTRTKEPFRPQTAGQVTMYVCGPTVYNDIHVGNARSAIAFDTIRRYLQFSGYQVTYVSNFTDVDDKIIAKAAAEGVPEQVIAARYAASVDRDSDQLGILPPTTRTWATAVMPDIITFIEDLLAKGVAYCSGGDVYFRARHQADYAQLAHQALDDLAIGASGRLSDSEAAAKKDPLDFALWKAVADEETIAWDASFGRGRPGWHIECSVMIAKYLGETIDIHGGGIDLAFPHHTNEIAQSEARHEAPLAKYWLHNGFVTVDDQKMSKSLGNFTTVRELLAQGVDPMALRYLLVNAHYRKPVSFTPTALANAQTVVNKLRASYQNLSERLADADVSANPTVIQPYRERFCAALDDDFNVPNALAVTFDLVAWGNRCLLADDSSLPELAAIQQELHAQADIFGLQLVVTVPDALPAELLALLEQRVAARERRDFAESDRLRACLAEAGICVKDTKTGQRWERTGKRG